MDGQSVDDKTIRQYLLGEAGDFEQQQVEEVLLVDEDGRRQIAIVEDELIEEYLAGELSADERARFESHFLAPESRRENLRVSRALRRYIEEHPRASRFAASRAGWSVPRPRLALAVAAVAIVAAAWLALSHRTPRGEFPGQQEVARTTAPAPVQAAVLTLSPGLLRSAGEEAVLKTRPAGTSVELDLALPQEGSGFASYGVTLAPVEDNEVWRQAGLRREEGAIKVSIPTSLLSRGDWRVAVSGVSAEGKSSGVSSYYFRVLFD